MKLSNRDRYSLTKRMNEMSDEELRGIKFTLNFRFLGHMKKNQQDAADSAKALTDEIRKELAKRAQDQHFKEVK